jgi:hypothetical protein
MKCRNQAAPSRVLLALVCLTVVGLHGCRQGPAMAEVAGRVTLDDQPIANGEILFLDGDNQQPPAMGQVVDGQYRLRVPIGSKRIEIRASRKVPGQGAMGEDYVWESYIPADYNVNSTLKANIESGRVNTFDFPLRSTAVSATN